MFNLSGSQYLLLLLVSVMWAFIGYRLSENDRRNLGRTPWGLPSVLWALFWFLSLLVGLILYLVAHGSGVRRAQQTGHGPPVASHFSAQARATPSAADLYPAYPRPANWQSQPDPVADEPAPPAQPETSAPPQPPPHWYPDPSGRFHYRWWDGAEWTSHVSTDGHLMVDTNPDQRIGPY